MTRKSLGIDKAPGDTRVVVAMSGGVDSSVTAALLREQGYDVVGITLHDYESRFRAEVMESFADAYVRGETPVPCIACNRTVKFRDLLKTARELGAEALATGHYVQRVMG